MKVTIVAVILGLVALATASTPVSLQFNSFTPASLSLWQLNGQTPTLNPNGGHYLWLVSGGYEAGTAFYADTIPLQDDHGFQASFSAAFCFRIEAPGGISDEDGQGADGLTFTLNTYSNNYGAVGGGLGYADLPQSLAIEFDTYNNGYPTDINGNHIGFDLNGNVQSFASVAYPTRMNDGQAHCAWVDYDGETQTLSARLSDDNVRPINANLVANVNLVNVFGNPNAYVGFTSGTGAAWGNHEILSFSFENTYKPIGQVTTGVPVATTGQVTTGVATTGAIIIDSCPVFDVDCNGAGFHAGDEDLSFLDYDVISFGDLNANTGDIEGRVAVRSNVVLGYGFSIGALLSDNAWYTLVAGRNVVWGSGDLAPVGSQAYVGGTFTAPSYLSDKQAPFSGDLDAAFDNAYACYSTESDALATLVDNVDQMVLYGAITLTCSNSGAKTYYVTVDGDTISSGNDWQTVGCNPNGEWIINVVGSNDITFSGNNFPSTGVVYNIKGSRTINVSTSVAGSILAPSATLNQVGGTIYGKVVVGTIANLLQVNIANCPNLPNGVHH